MNNFNNNMMKYIRTYFLLFILFVALSCSLEKKEIYGKPVMPPEKILENGNTLWNYRNKYLRLSEDYVSLDTNFKFISKKEFLALVSTGKYLPLRLISKDSTCYQLYKVGTPKDEYVTTLLYTIGVFAYKNYLMEQQVLPSFNFTDIEGNRYNPETTKGKIIIFKCWFIHCKTCVEEMPMLNKMLETYKNRKDIIFTSLASDNKAELKKFLKKTEFKWATIPNQRDYLRNVLDIIAFPTYIIVNKKGIISKVIQGYKEMEIALADECQK